MAKRMSRWIKNLLRIYQVDKEHKNLSQWIEKAVENVLSRNPEISMDREAIEMLSRRQRAQENSSMDWESVEDLLRKEKDKLDRKESFEDLSRSCQAWRKGVFQGGRNTRKYMQQASNSTKDPNNMLSSQNSTQHRCKAFIDPNTHTHTRIKQV